MPSISFTQPDMSYQDSSDDFMKRLTDDYGRHRLTDLVEADESEEDGLDYLKSTIPRNRYTSTDSASSMDGLWELHPRRLSEAGLSRHSDSSAVLTEDTDSFMIGQRVWVGGTKPGTIAYIGETQFAPGDWAGIALDEPIGKNDGSVGGIRYFQCENKKGVFSRLTRLTRVPLEQPGMGSNETFTSPNGIRRSPLSPNGSTRSLLKSPVSLSASNTSLNSSATHVDFKIGDRVIIKSTQGSKVGTVRYMGLTDFAPGEWVGVELDDPRGKNDGSVEGKRYFECRPNFGLFAPIAKVSKSPSKYKPAACAVHSGGLPPSGLKRVNSKESMTSMTSKTSAASSVRRVRLGVTSLTPKKVSPKTSTPLPTRTALQDVLREKQQHIEQLLKERDLERAEITRAASQADEAEQKFFVLKQEFEKYRAECELRIKENSDVLNDLKLDRDELLSQLEDEKRKNEDLQFRFEEAAITKSDVEVINENYVKRMGELESNLAQERQKSETLESTSNKLFEAEESLIKAREEIDSLRNELTKSQTEWNNLDLERSKLVESLQKQLDDVNLENQDKSNKISQLTEDIFNLKSDHKISEKQTEDDCKNKDQEIEKLKAEIENQNKIIEKYHQTQIELNKENDKLKMQLSSVNLDCETTNENLMGKEKEIKLLTDELFTVKKNLNEKIDDLERRNGNAAKIEEDLRKELTQTREDLKTKITEFENIKKDLTIEISQKDQQLYEKNNTITQNNDEIKKLNEELTSVKANFEETKNELHNRHTRQVASQDSQLMTLTAEIQQKNEEITKSVMTIRKLEEELIAKNNNIEKLRLELETYTKQQTQQFEASSVLQSQINELSLKNNDLQRQLDSANNRINEFLSLRQRLEDEIQKLSVKCDNAEQLENLRAEIKSKEESLVNIRTEFETKYQNSERLREELEIKHQKSVTEFEKLSLELETKLQISQQSEALLQQQCEAHLSKLSTDRDEFSLKISELEQTLQGKELILANLQEKLQETERFYQEQIKSITDDLNRNLGNSQDKIISLNDEIVRLYDEINSKTEKIIEVEAKASHTIVQSEQTKKELEQKFTEEIKRLEFNLNEKILELNKLTSELYLVKQDCLSNNSDLAAKDHRLGELMADLKQSQDVVSQLQEQLNLLQSNQIQTKQEYLNLQNQNQELLQQVTVLTNKLQIGEDVFKDLKNEYNGVVLLVNRLKITEQQKQECLQQLQHEAVLTADQKNCSHVLDLLNKIKIDSNTTNIEVIANLQKDIDVIRNQLIERNNQYETQQQELLKLQQELLKAKELQAPGGPNQDSNSIKSQCYNSDQHLQDKEFAENQIKFLNSIIVDIQKKNEEQRARIEILEAGCSPAFADEMKSIGQGERNLPPRMYCDICEEFDLHETEDCPQQNTDVVIVNENRGNLTVTDRPYCEICEVFGHATENCQEDQTF